MEQSVKQKNPAAVKLGRLGGRAGRGAAKSRSEQVKAWWVSPAGEALRLRLLIKKCTNEEQKQRLGSG